MNENKSSGIFFNSLRSVLCVIMAGVLAVSMIPITEQAYAANEEKADSVFLELGKIQRTDVTKTVVTLDANMGKGITIPFDVKDKYNNLGANEKRRYLVSEDAQGTQSQLSETSANRVGFMSDQIVAGQKLKLVTSTKDKNGNFVKRYEQQLNVRFVDTRKAEQKPSTATQTSAAAGMSKDGSSWSFSDGLQVELKNTGFKFLDGTSINLGGMALPLKYKHEANGTTIVGINCDPNNVAFYKAVKNGNVWQKYTTEKMAEMTKQMDKGWSGKGFGKWGGKAFDWNVMGFMEYNTKDPNAPRAVNLIISLGMKAEGHAQYLCFTGTLTFTIGGKATLIGKFTPAKGVEGKFKLGGYGGLELYVGLGLNYVASIGTFGKGRIDIDFEILPKLLLDTIKVSGAFGVKAKAFGFTLFTWNILKGEKQLYPKESNTKKMPTPNEDGSATSPFEVDADTVYPIDSREYLNNGSGLAAAHSDALTAQATESATTILEGIYGETELSCATSSSGPVIVYIADADQVGDKTRDAANRSVLVYKRMNSDGSWTPARVIDAGASSATKDFADYSPTIHAVGDTCYVTWLAAKEKINEGDTIGQVGKKLDVKMATISKGTDITKDTITVETVYAESGNTDSMPANPQAIKVGNDLYVGWYTNQTSGASGEVIGVSGNHSIRLYKKGDNGWAVAREVTTGQSGAITSFDVGQYGNTAACVWSLDEKFQEKYSASESAEESDTPDNDGITLNGVDSLAGSTVYALTPDSNKANIVAMNATNAQFAKQSGKDVLTYAVLNSANDGVSNPYINVNSSPSLGVSGPVVLDGSKVALPTGHYVITGDLGEGRAGNLSFLKTGDGTCDIQALVTTGAGSADWTSVVEATADTATIADYCATYANGLPLFIYTTERVFAEEGEDLSAQADDDGSVDMNQTTSQSLKHLSVSDVDYDEYEVNAGQTMPITVDFDNDGMLDVSGIDLYKLEDDSVEMVAHSDATVALDGDGDISFDYTLPGKEEFTKAREFTLYAAPTGTTVNAAKIKRELADGSAMTISFGAASLSLSTEHQVVDDQESIIATVKNDGIVPHGAKLVFVDSDTGEFLTSVDVPELGEEETFTWKYDAPDGYFQNSGVKNIIITLENDGTESDGYEINNTEFVSTWEVIPDSETPAATKAAPSNAKTGDQYLLAIILALLALALVMTPIVIRAARKARNQ